MFPQGFMVNGVHCGIAKKKDKNDLAVFYSDRPCVTAGMFTRNRVTAAPVLVSAEHLRTQKNIGIRAVVVNSGCANACTGTRGLTDARAMARAGAAALSVTPTAVLTASTGVIGKYLPMANLRAGITAACARLKQGISDPDAAISAIMTTDTVRKVASRTVTVGSRKISIWGCVKGAGMIHPDLAGLHATMLGFILTDATLTPAFANKALAEAVDRSFNCVSVDGDTSTNDTILLMANGAAGASLLSGGTAARQFCAALNDVCLELAKGIARDGEGANHLVTIRVRNAASAAAAKKIAATIATSPLVKTAVFGADANWGRVIAAAGRAGVPLDPARTDIYFDALKVARNGCPVNFSEEKAKKILQQPELTITVDLKSGTAAAVYYTCDFSLDYVKINADYRT